jgi:hypothetical protein
VLGVGASRESQTGLLRTTGQGRCGTAESSYVRNERKLLKGNYAQGIETRTLSQHTQETEIREAHEEEGTEGSTYGQSV